MESLVKFAKQRKGIVAALIVVVVFVLMYVTDAKQLAPMFSNVGTGALISAIALGVVLTYRGSGVLNFANGVVTIFIAYWFYGLRFEGKLYIPPLPNPLALIEIVANLFNGSRENLDLPNWPTVIDLPGERLTLPAA